MIDSEVLSAYMSHALSNQLSLRTLHTVVSTSDYLLKGNHPLGCVCIADTQSCGRGRYGHSWYSPAGKNLYLSLLWEFESETPLLPLPLLASVFIARGLRRYGIESIGIKWPNDFYIEGQKSGGLLIDTVFQRNTSVKVVLGIGINVFSQTFPDEIGQPVTTLQDHLVHRSSSNLSVEAVAASVLDSLLEVLELDPVQWSVVLKRHWSTYDVALNRRVAMTRNGGVIEGTAQGINDALQLRLLSNGTEHFFNEVDSSMRLL